MFDIDISDYDDVRTCCCEAAICTKCWPLVSHVVSVIDVILRRDFGSRHSSWVFLEDVAFIGGVQMIFTKHWNLCSTKVSND